jgi:peptidoglycan/LPS O-acetylase OafA/YrhL
MTTVDPLEQVQSAPATRTTPVRHLQELEGMRALAAGAVLLTHAGFVSGAIGGSVLPGFLARMDIGVAIFFVLSGFLLYRPHARANAGLGPRPDRRAYAARRAARLVPAWLCVLAVTPLLAPEARSASLASWAANLTQLQALRQDWLLPGLAQLWSLSTEVMFYLALPFLAAAIGAIVRGRRPRAELLALAGLVLLAQAFRAAYQLEVLPEGWSWLQTLPGMLDWFAAGMALACLTAAPGRFTATVDTIRRSAAALWTIAACLLWVLTTRLAGPYDLAAPTWAEQTFKHVGYGLFALLVVAPSACGGSSPASSILASRLMGYLGKISYAVFLWHLPVMFALRDVLGYRLFAGHFWMTVVGTAVLTVPIAAASWHLVEHPIQRIVRARTS